MVNRQVVVGEGGPGRDKVEVMAEQEEAIKDRENCKYYDRLLVVRPSASLSE